jgi:hypothetical protein
MRQTRSKAKESPEIILHALKPKKYNKKVKSY